MPSEMNSIRNGASTNGETGIAVYNQEEMKLKQINLIK
jgi:hypothetical protein